LIPLKDNIPTGRFPVLTVAIIVANIVVFVFFQGALFGPHGGFSSSGDQTKVIEYSFIPYELSHPGKKCGELDGSLVCERQEGQLDQAGATPGDDQPPVWLTIFTSMFMHGGVLHIAGNMLFLWIFGNNIEDAMGRLKFALFYLAGGVVAALTHFFLGGVNEVTPTLGASGAIAAVLGGYALLYPKARVVTLVIIIFFITVITLPALLVLGFWFLLQLLDAASQPLGGSGVAVWAHVGGFVFGLLTVKLLATRYDPDYDRRARLPVY
jgi:membrane associated rhomboid family serine protease